MKLMKGEVDGYRYWQFIDGNECPKAWFIFILKKLRIANWINK